jgi:hypothetical protein
VNVHDERRWLIRNPILWVVLPIVAVALGAGFTVPEARLILLPVAVLFGLLLAANLRIQVEGDVLRLTYFPLWSRTIPLSSIVQAEVVPYRWWRYGGWGIRFGFDGSISYSAWEKEAVRLTIAGKRPVNVGTMRPHDLVAALGKR